MTYIALAIGIVGVLLLISSAALRRRIRVAPEDAALRAEVQTALARRETVLAIRLYRERTGAGLLEARDAVERINRGSKSS